MPLQAPVKIGGWSVWTVSADDEDHKQVSAIVSSHVRTHVSARHAGIGPISASPTAMSIARLRVPARPYPHDGHAAGDAEIEPVPACRCMHTAASSVRMCVHMSACAPVHVSTHILMDG